MHGWVEILMISKHFDHQLPEVDAVLAVAKARRAQAQMFQTWAHSIGNEPSPFSKHLVGHNFAITTIRFELLFVLIGWRLQLQVGSPDRVENPDFLEQRCAFPPILLGQSVVLDRSSSTLDELSDVGLVLGIQHPTPRILVLLQTATDRVVQPGACRDGMLLGKLPFGHR